MGKIGNHAIKTEKYFGTVMSVCQQVNIFEWKFQLPNILDNITKYKCIISLVIFDIIFYNPGPKIHATRPEFFTPDRKYTHPDSDRPRANPPRTGPDRKVSGSYAPTPNSVRVGPGRAGEFRGIGVPRRALLLILVPYLQCRSVSDQFYGRSCLSTEGQRGTMLS